MTRILRMTALLLLVCIAASAEAAPFSFQGSLSWTSAEADALAFLGEGAERVVDVDEDLGALTRLTVSGRELFGSRCDRLTLVCYDDELIGIFAYYYGKDVADWLDLLDAVALEYGEPSSYGARNANTPVTGAYAVGCLWETEDTTIAYYFNDRPSARYPYTYCLAFENTSVMSALYEAAGAIDPAAEG